MERKAKVNSLFAGYKTSAFPNTNEITAQELKAMLDNQASSPVVVVDVRTEAEMEVSVIPNAIKQAEYEQQQERYKSHTVVAYCTIGMRSGKYCHTLKGKGIAALNLKGSILSWTLEGYPLADPVSGDDTKRVHVYGKTWNLVGAGYQAIWHQKPLLIQVLLDSIKGLLQKVVPKSMWPTWLFGKRL